MIFLGTVITASTSGYHVVIGIDFDSQGNPSIVNYQQIATAAGIRVDNGECYTCHIEYCNEVTYQTVYNQFFAEMQELMQKGDRIDALFQEFVIGDGVE